jgi:hypothetical protein
VKAEFNGSSSYEAASNTKTINIDKATLTVTADNNTKTYGETNPSFAASYSGFKNGESSSVLTGTPAFSSTANQDSKAGTYPITPAQGTLAADNYKFSSTNGTLNVNKRDATVVYDGQNYATIASAGNATINLSAKVSRTAGGSLGDLAQAKVQFTVKKFSGPFRRP